MECRFERSYDSCSDNGQNTPFPLLIYSSGIQASVAANHNSTTTTEQPTICIPVSAESIITNSETESPKKVNLNHRQAVAPRHTRLKPHHQSRVQALSYSEPSLAGYRPIRRTTVNCCVPLLCTMPNCHQMNNCTVHEMLPKAYQHYYTHTMGKYKAVGREK